MLPFRGESARNVGVMKQEPAYRLPLPAPALTKSLAEGAGAAISPTIKSTLESLAVANAGGDLGGTNDDDTGLTLNFPIPMPATSVEKAPGDRFGIYEAYFELDRLPESATKAQAMDALTVALAIVMEDAKKTEASRCGVSPIEFAILRQAFAVVVETLSEITSTQAES